MRKVVIAAVVLLTAVGAWAQGSKDTIELTPTIGFWFGDTLARGSSESVDFDVDIDDGNAYGLRLGYRYTENWALEAGLFHESSDLVTAHDEVFGGREVLGDVKLDAFEIGFEGSFGHSRLVPFVAGGVGAMRIDPDMVGMGSETRFVGHFGGGFKLFFTPQLAFRFDYRGHFVDIGNREDDCDWWDDCAHNDDVMNLREMSIGLTFVF